MNKTRLQKFGFDKTLIRFIIVGGCCTLIDFAMYMLIMEHVGAVIGKAVSMGCSMLVNFFLNKFWSFSAGGASMCLLMQESYMCLIGRSWHLLVPQEWR